MTNYLSSQTQDVFDVALAKYGGLTGLAALLASNPEIVKGDGTIEQFRTEYLVEGTSVTLTELEKITQQQTEAEKIQGTPIYISGALQTVFDVALTEYGGLGGLALLITDNPDLILDNGEVRQFRQPHYIQKDSFVNLKTKAAMLKLRPQSEGGGPAGDWITDDGDSWWTDDNQSWTTEK